MKLPLALLCCSRGGTEDGTRHSATRCRQPECIRTSSRGSGGHGAIWLTTVFRCSRERASPFREGCLSNIRWEPSGLPPSDRRSWRRWWHPCRRTPSARLLRQGVLAGSEWCRKPKENPEKKLRLESWKEKVSFSFSKSWMWA